jgi:hypothetical protein
MSDYERLYIIDPNKFKGSVFNTMTAPAGITPTHVDYMDKPTTFEEYKKEKGNENLIALTWEEFDEQYNKPHLNSLQKPFTEITREEYWEMLECLPPKRWTNIGVDKEFFFLGECYTADLYTLCVKTGGKYFSGLRSIFMKKEDIITQIQEQCQ